MPQHAPAEGRRHALLSTLLIVVIRIIFVGALIAILLPDDVAAPVATAVIILLISVPIFRLCWFATRWFRRGDVRYAFIATGLFITIASGAALNYFVQ